MKIQQLALFAVAATLSLSAFADPTIAPAANHADVAQKVAESAVREHGAYRLTADEATNMRGSFQLSDGRTLKVTAKRNRLYAELDGKAEELVPVSENTFVSRDSGMRVAFKHVPFSDEVTVDTAAR